MKKLFVLFLTLFFSLAVFPIHAQEIFTTDKLITVDTGKQMLYAWEGGKIVYQTAVSTGLPKSPTIKGTFKIYLKHSIQANMKGISPYIGRYNLKNVPHVMYFSGNYAIHGAYWHNSFGRRASNGCVNVPLVAAEWLFNFAEKGTTVMVF
jgi:lipoprotein-anchoring transpeptidase ErfK/SrfK